MTFGKDIIRVIYSLKSWLIAVYRQSLVHFLHFALPSSLLSKKYPNSVKFHLWTSVSEMKTATTVSKHMSTGIRQSIQLCGPAVTYHVINLIPGVIFSLQ